VRPDQDPADDEPEHRGLAESRRDRAADERGGERHGEVRDQRIGHQALSIRASRVESVVEAFGAEARKSCTVAGVTLARG
jgi:hypothetical protein